MPIKKVVKDKKCKVCKGLFTPIRPLQMVCNHKCAIEYTNNLKSKAWNKEKKVLKESIKTLGEYEKEARIVFQRWIRERDKSYPCISCGTTSTELWDAGHYLKAEIYSGLIFLEINCNKQCRKCNRFLNGNELKYREGLIKKIGEETLRELEGIKDCYRIRKYSKEELKEIKKHYSVLLKKYDKA